VDLARRAHRLKIALLTCLFAAWPLAASADTTGAARSAGQVAVSKTAPVDADDPIWRWFREQDKVLDDILLRLTRIEALVSDIQHLVSRMPDAGQAMPPAAAVPAPAPQQVAPASPPAKPTAPRPAPPASAPATQAGDAGIIAEWGPQLAGGALILLLLLWWSRRRTAATPGKAATPVAAPAKAAIGPSATPAPQAAAAEKEKAPVEDDDLDLGTAGEPSPQADQAYELAEIMLSMGLGHGAAQTLAEQIRNEPKQALRHWLRLLDIYRKNGQQDEFERSAEELRQHFNVKPEDWHVPPEAMQSVENYPHISTRLTELWGKPACLVYLNNLLADNRGGSRAGFPQSVAEELLLLVALLKQEGIAG
jgi:hypothetical protein